MSHFDYYTGTWTHNQDCLGALDSYKDLIQMYENQGKLVNSRSSWTNRSTVCINNVSCNFSKHCNIRIGEDEVLTPMARRNDPLKNAPNNAALWNPNENADGTSVAPLWHINLLRPLILKLGIRALLTTRAAIRVTTKPITSVSTWKLSATSARDLFLKPWRVKLC